MAWLPCTWQTKIMGLYSKSNLIEFKPIQSQYKANTKPIQSQYKANTNIKSQTPCKPLSKLRADFESYNLIRKNRSRRWKSQNKQKGSMTYSQPPSKNLAQRRLMYVLQHQKQQIRKRQSQMSTAFKMCQNLSRPNGTRE